MQYSHLSETITIKKVKVDGNVGVFQIEGLYMGYGVTLGNALRRTLLSSLPGSAITQIKIKGVDHEFSTLPGMIEDVVAFVLNLKKVRFQFFADEPQVLALRVKGEKEVTADDIESTTFAQVINKDLHLASLTKKTAELDMELTVEKGLGYVPTETRKLERLTVGTIMLDAIFSPVVKVDFKVENMRVGELTDYNRLTIEIETDGSITPESALHKASNILKDHFDKVAMATESEINAEEKEEGKTKKKKK